MKISFLKIIFALALLLGVHVAYAAPVPLSGWAWSSNIGWISFNGVNKNDSDTLTGYAWSSNIGWIQFGNLDTNTMPSGSGTQKINAKINGNNLQGWAKALSANGNGWDGWISLSGAGYGVTLSGNNFTGFAWGSDVVGWINFNDVIIGLPVLDFTLTPGPDVTITKGTVSVSAGNIVSTLVLGNPNQVAFINWLSNIEKPDIPGFLVSILNPPRSPNSLWKYSQSSFRCIRRS